ncbi:arylformamidase [Bacillus sp. S/N-304-OC-R1]|uniref:arylformamidase n=1 Tax=Bacillus sp. S/N-304-OC-R1 TaxID=2758034 RepID=UPI001C8DE9D3|nr:arylformamidase [Bacillus sp. S/N-304-OC-R1]MBY0123158.1 arylformamidase [Bacillus sp. S/N-304-OC-R1]
MNKWIDISQRLDNGLAVWPGDTPFSLQNKWSIASGSSVNVGELTMSTHSGTHIDAPFHFDNLGKKVIDLDINLYIGPARVIHLQDVSSIGEKELSNYELSGVTRLLINTGAWGNRTVFPDKIPYLEKDAAQYLSTIGVKLLGLDLPSVDPLDSKELPAHHALHHCEIHILEGLVLDSISEGDYELVALPLPIVNGDGSPVRAVLKKIGV